jgi:MOSC domain-containing protein YiiM
MPFVESLNIGVPHPIAAKSGSSAIGKKPVTGPVLLRPVDEPGASAVAGDHICDTQNHGGRDQAVYAYAREDLDAWQNELERPLPSGTFGENLTTRGIDVNEALVGERWRIGTEVVLQVTLPRVPCRTFATWLELEGWVKTFTLRAMPGAYLRVVREGSVSPGDPVVVEHQPDHDVSVATVFRAFTTDPSLLPRVAEAEDLPDDTKDRARRRLPLELD